MHLPTTGLASRQQTSSLEHIRYPGTTSAVSFQSPCPVLRAQARLAETNMRTQGEDPDDTSTLVGGRKFAPVVSEQRVSPGFEGSPAGLLGSPRLGFLSWLVSRRGMIASLRSSITLCFVFTQGARELVATDPGLAVQSLGLLSLPQS